MLIVDANGLSRFNINTIVVAVTFFLGDTDAFVIQVKAVSAGATIHR